MLNWKKGTFSTHLPYSSIDIHYVFKGRARSSVGKYRSRAFRSQDLIPDLKNVVPVHIFSQLSILNLLFLIL